MSQLYDPARHEPLRALTWDELAVRDAVAEICRDAESAFNPATLWPLHPRDEEPGGPPDGVYRGLYLGAAGMLHALQRLAEAGLHSARLDRPAVAARLHEAALTSPDEEGAGGSLMIGSSGILLVVHRLTGSPEAADALAEVIGANIEHPSNELLLGAPGTMLAARAMHDRTGEERFVRLWRSSAATLLARQDTDGLWTQDMYGECVRYVGAGHGFAGNVKALLAAPEWLEDAAAVERRALATARELAVTAPGQASWPTLADGSGSRTGAPPRVQWCHGAPGMIISLASWGQGDDVLDALLTAGGEFVWRAGPIAGNAGLCHGTAGNGFALLALARRTGDDRWLDRARSFAAHALDQVRGWRIAEDRGRYSLFTGDLGAALLAAACLTGDTRFPGLDDLAQ